jgi:CO/xanthine dehydrogenase FAD-binding subunit
MNFRCLRPSVLIDINRIADLSYVRRVDGSIRIGAMTRQRTLEFDPLIREHLPLMHAAVPYIAHPVIRNRGTIGGSLSFADPAAELAATTLALEARYRAASPRGDRWIEADGFFTGLYQHAMDPDEVLVEIDVPVQAPGSGWAFQEIARRQGDRVLMGVAAVVRVDDQAVCREARLVYQNAAPTPRLALHASRVLTGSTPSKDLFIAAADAASLEDIDPISDVHASAPFRRHLARELTLRVLEAAFQRALHPQDRPSSDGKTA